MRLKDAEATLEMLPYDLSGFEWSFMSKNQEEDDPEEEDWDEDDWDEEF